MTSIGSIDVSGAAHALAVANTPLFIVRKLKELEATRRLAEFPTKDILAAIKEDVENPAGDLSGFARTYSLLVALALKGDALALRTVSNYRAPYHRWYYHLAAILEQQRQSTSHSIAANPSKLKVILAKQDSQSEQSGTTRIIL